MVRVIPTVWESLHFQGVGVSFHQFRNFSLTGHLLKKPALLTPHPHGCHRLFSGLFIKILLAITWSYLLLSL